MPVSDSHFEEILRWTGRADVFRALIELDYSPIPYDFTTRKGWVLEVGMAPYPIWAVIAYAALRGRFKVPLSGSTGTESDQSLDFNKHREDLCQLHLMSLGFIATWME